MVKDELGDLFTDKGLNDQAIDVVSEMMGNKVGPLAEELYKKDYKDGFGNKTDKEIQKAYAEAMGWDPDNIKNKGGNKATYYDKQGNEVKADLDDDVARRFLA